MAIAEAQALERVLQGAVLLGLEVDLRYRVLAATIEPTAGNDPRGGVGDHRLQVLCHPVSTILGSLRRRVGESTVVETFEAEQLVDVAAAFAGCALAAPVLGRPEPRPGGWGPSWSLQGRSTAPNGRRTTATFSVATDDAALDVFVRCDEVELRDPAGEAVDTE